MAKGRVVKFCTQVDCIIACLKDDIPPQKGRDQGHVTRFLTLPHHIFGNDEARHVKFRLLFDTQEC